MLQLSTTTVVRVSEWGRVVKISYFYRVVLVPDISAAGHGGSKQYTDQQKPRAEGQSSNKNQNRPNRKQSTHDATANGDPVDRDSAMALRVPHLLPPQFTPCFVSLEITWR
jgi:hypothetical protein